MFLQRFGQTYSLFRQFSCSIVKILIQFSVYLEKHYVRKTWQWGVLHKEHSWVFVGGKWTCMWIARALLPYHSEYGSLLITRDRVNQDCYISTPLKIFQSMPALILHATSSFALVSCSSKLVFQDQMVVLSSGLQVAWKGRRVRKEARSTEQFLITVIPVSYPTPPTQQSIPILLFLCYFFI